MEGVTFPIAFSGRALAEMDAIYRWIASEAGKDVAYAYDMRLRGAIRSLQDFPNRGTPRPKWGKGFRSFTFERRRVVVFRVEDDRVEILRVLHAAQDHSKMDRG